jgi:phosphatidylglycerol---prolipoprotein diacylglyceryl transferase
VTDSWMGIVFPAGGPFPRHPSQIYEAVLEGLVLGAALFFIHRKQRFYGPVTTVFLIGYGSLRFVAEFFREPDVHLGFFLTYFTLGQIFSLMMLPFGLVLYKHARYLNIKNPIFDSPVSSAPIE